MNLTLLRVPSESPLSFFGLLWSAVSLGILALLRQLALLFLQLPMDIDLTLRTILPGTNLLSADLTCQKRLGALGNLQPPLL